MCEQRACVFKSSEYSDETLRLYRPTRALAARQCDGSSEYPRRMFKLMGKTIISILCSKTILAIDKHVVCENSHHNQVYLMELVHYLLC